eukprot:gene11368-biopygen6363
MTPGGGDGSGGFRGSSGVSGCAGQAPASLGDRRTGGNSSGRGPDADPDAGRTIEFEGTDAADADRARAWPFLPGQV